MCIRLAGAHPMTAPCPKAIATIASFCALLAHARAVAAPSDQQPVALSLDQALALAQRVAPDLRLAEGRVREADASKVGASVRLPVNPRISFDGRPGLDRETRGKIGYASSLDFVFELGSVPASRMREADARIDLARAETAQNRLDVHARVLRAYTGTRLGNLRIEQATQAITIAERILAATRDRLAAGAGSDIEVTSAQIELATLRGELFRARGDRTRFEMELRHLLGLSATAAIELTSPADKPEPGPPIESLVRYALAHRPDFVVMQARLSLLAASDERLRREARPKLGLAAGLDASPQSPMFGSLGLSIELPVAQRNQGPRALVAAERWTENLRLEIERSRAELELRATLAAYESRLAEMDVLTQEGIPAAEQRLDLVETGWRSGRFDIFRLTTAARELVQMKALRLGLLEQIWLERANLITLSGGWPDERS
jgi:cobalt-zinc-cadmium efflux system outer membrane protein